MMSLSSAWFAASQVLGWTLVHFLWQGSLLGLVYAGLRPLLTRGAARYRLGMGMLFAFTLCPLLTMWKLLAQPAYLAASGTGSAMAVAASVELETHGAGAILTGFDALLPWLVSAWSLGVLLLSARAWREWRGLKVLVRMAGPAPAWQRAATDLAQRFGLRRGVVVLCSRVISTPVLIGWIRPVILLPLAVATGFPATQVELILAHELAHLRRLDPLANLFQVVVETMHFYHPVVRWISREVRNEREICCDRLALTISGGSRREFITVLAELGDLRMQHETLLLAASGGVLLDRAQQMMMLPGRQVSDARRSGHLAAVLLGAVLVVLALQLQWTQAHLRRGMDASMKQLQALVAGMKVPLANRAADIPGLDLAAMQFGSIRLPTPALKAAVAPPLLSLGVANLPRAHTWSVTDVQPDRPAPLSLHMNPVTSGSSLSDAAPVPVHVRQPVYPQLALQRGIEGQVVVEFSLASDGGVIDLRLVKATPAGVFDQAALEAMRGWRYNLPNATVASRRFRQTIAFSLNTARAGGAASRNIHARADCQIVTGTHICRWPDEANAQVPSSTVQGLQLSR